MSKPAKRRSNRYVSRKERRMIRRTEARVPALVAAVKTLLEIHSLEARAVREFGRAPWIWVVERSAATPHTHGTPWPKKRPVFQMDVKSSLADWQERVSKPDKGLMWMGYADHPSAWQYEQTSYYQQMARVSGYSQAIHDEVIHVDLEEIEARMDRAFAEKDAAYCAAVAARPVRNKSEP